MMHLPPEEGHATIEYALILTLMILAVIVVLALLGPAIGNVFSRLHSI